MAVTVSTLHTDRLNKTRIKAVEITFDSSYPTGGEPITAAMFGFTRIISVFAIQCDDAGYDPVWDRTNSKILLYDEDNTSGIAADAANTSDQSGRVVTAVVWGI